jgi:hypothetical protein
VFGAGRGHEDDIIPSASLQAREREEIVRYELFSKPVGRNVVLFLVLDIEQASRVDLITRRPGQVEAVLECGNHYEIGFGRLFKRFLHSFKDWLLLVGVLFILTHKKKTPTFSGRGDHFHKVGIGRGALGRRRQHSETILFIRQQTCHNATQLVSISNSYRWLHETGRFGNAGTNKFS